MNPSSNGHITVENLKADEQELLTQLRGLQMMIQYNRQLQEATKKKEEENSVTETAPLPS